MRTLTSFLAGLMLVLTAWTGTAHAAELVGCSAPIQAEMGVHVTGDCDQVPADADTGYPHHHDGCHGQHVSIPAPDQAVLRSVRVQPAYGISRADRLAAFETDRTLRPPQA